MVAVDRAVDLIDKRIDVAIRVRTALRTDAALFTRTLSHSGRILMAAPGLAKKCKTKDLDALTALPTLASTETGIVHIVFTTRRGLPPVVRAFIEHLAGSLKSSLASAEP
jgi:DNA-binding transcriptional LysR family regulator